MSFVSLDLRRCAEAAAHAALAEAFARPEAPPPPPKRPPKALKAVLLGAGLVTGARFLLNADLRKAVTEGLLGRLPLDELFEGLDLDLERDLGFELGGSPKPATDVDEKAEHDATEMNSAAR